MNVYDFDKTIYNTDSTFAFYRWCLVRHGKIALTIPEAFAAWVKFYVFHSGNKTQFKQTMYRFLTCVPNVEEEVKSFWNEKKDGIMPWYLQKKREDDVIISASPEFLIEPIGAMLGVHTIASRVDKKTGVYTGLNCHGEEKVVRFRKIYPDAEVDEFYSDALSDTPMARLAKKAFLVRKNKIKPWIYKK